MARLNRCFTFLISLSFFSLIILQQSTWFNFSSSMFLSEPYSWSSLVKIENQTNFPRCQPVNKICFLRTHKCGSTTIQNILFREAVNNKLKVAMHSVIGTHTANEMVLRNYTETLNHRNLTWLAGVEMDLLAEHFRWESSGKKYVSKILGSEFKIFTILRDPVDRFESQYSFNSMDKLFGLGLKEFIQLFQNNTFRNMSLTEIKQKYRMKERASFLVGNQMALDLGLSSDSFDDEGAVDKLIANIENDFDLVMITEKMDESLILLRHLLCLPMENITSLVINARKPEYKVKLNPEERKVLTEHWLAADEKIYRHFYNIFEAKVNAFGRSTIEEEVRMLRSANEKVKDRCIVKQTGNEVPGRTYHSINPKAVGYILKQREAGCKFYGMIAQEFRKMFLKTLSNQLRPSLQDYNLAVKSFFN